MESTSTNITIRMDKETKRNFENFCDNVGINMTTAFNMFARAVLRERRLPFEVGIESDPFFSEGNLAYLRRVKADAEAGRNMSIHEIVEINEGA